MEDLCAALGFYLARFMGRKGGHERKEGTREGGDNLLPLLQGYLTWSGEL